MAETFRAEYVTRRGRLACDTQAPYALALLFGLFGPKEEQTRTARARLDWMGRWEAFKITTGFAGTPIILQVLADNGMLSNAYRMLQERDCPRWLYPVAMGAKTIVSGHGPKTFHQNVSNRAPVGALELDATRWHQQPAPDDFVQPLRPWLSMQVPAQDGRWPESCLARLEDRSGLPQARRNDPSRPHVVWLPIRTLYRELKN